MATLAAAVPTLVEVTKTLDPNGSSAVIAELLNESNPIIEDVPWFEGNLPTGHRITQRTSLPGATWRRFNQGVTPTKGTQDQVDEQCGMLHAWSEVDKDLAELNGNTAEFRMGQSLAYFEALAQEFAGTLLYGNQGAAQEEFNGIATRYADINGVNGRNIIDAGGSGSDNTSIYLVGWGRGRVYGVYPKGTMAGLMHENLGLQTSETSAAPGGGKIRVYQDHYQWKCGLAVEDWRYVVRIGSIDVSDTVADGAGTTVKLIEMMVKAIHRFPSMANIRPCFYCNPTIAQMLDIQAMNKSNVHLTTGVEEGIPKTRLRGIPVKACDQIVETETLV